MANLLVEIVSPDGAKFRGEARRFKAPGVEGLFEVLPGHTPLLAATRVGPVTITLPNGDRVVYATSGGFVEVLDDHVIMLAQTAEPASAIDVERAKAAEAHALERLHATLTPAERAEAEAELQRARNRARVAMGQVGARN